MASTKISGRFGAVDTFSTVYGWTLEETQNDVPTAASNSRAGTMRRASTRDWTGTITMGGAEPLHFPGDEFTFSGYVGPNSGVQFGAGQVYTGQALVESVEITWDWEGGTPLRHVVNFGGHGALSNSVDNPIEDLSTPVMPSVCNTKIDWGTAASEIDWTDLSNATLTFTNALQTVVDSSTSCWTERFAGVLDWTLSLTSMNVSRLSADVPDLGDSERIRIFDDLTSFWELEKGFIISRPGNNVSIEDGAMVTNNWEIGMQADDGTGIGAITAPDLSVVWPAAVTATTTT